MAGLNTGRIFHAGSQNDDRLIFPRIGFIKVGIKSDRGYPMSVDYFVPVGKYDRLFTVAYGEKPSTIQIIFPDDDPAKVCNERYEYRDDNGDLIASGDGFLFQIWNGKEYQDFSAEEYPDLMQRVSSKYSTRNSKRCSSDGWITVLTLRFIIPMVKGIAGIWEFSTKGTSSTIPQIKAIFDGMLAERGFVKGIIWDLSVKFATTQKPGNNNRFPVVSLVPNESEENVLKIKQAFEPIKLLSNKNENN